MSVNVFIIKAKSTVEGDLILAITLSVADAVQRCAIIIDHSPYPADRVFFDEYPVCGQMNFSMYHGEIEVTTLCPVRSYDSFGTILAERKEVHPS